MEYIIAIGDSNTEWGFSSTWLSRLAHYYSRRATVINSGQRGYNSRWMLQMLKNDRTRSVLLPQYARSPLFVTVMLGTNDLAHPSTGQHVPVNEYVANVQEIVSIIRRECRPKGGVFVMTPPPVDEGFCPPVGGANNGGQQSGVYNRMAPNAMVTPNRRFDASREYRAALVNAFNQSTSRRENENVFFVDIQTAILQHGDPTFLFTAPEDVSYNPDAPWTRLFPDGIHLGDVAGELVFSMLLDAVRHSPQANQILPLFLTPPLPEYDDLARKDEGGRSGGW